MVQLEEKTEEGPTGHAPGNGSRVLPAQKLMGAPGCGEHAVVKDGTVETEGLEDFGQDIYAGYSLQRRSVGKLYRTLDQVTRRLERCG